MNLETLNRSLIKKGNVTRLAFYSWSAHITQTRTASSAAIAKAEFARSLPAASTLDRLPTPDLLRSVLLGTVWRRQWLFRPALRFMEKVANSKSVLMDADRNIFLRAVIYPFIYKHFCAGRNQHEVRHTISKIKKMGYTGVILCYARELTVSETETDKGLKPIEASIVANIKAWHDGNMRTLEAVGPGDYIGIKLTGADESISADIAAGKPMREDFIAALEELCQHAQDSGKYLWFDAEEQKYHPAIDNTAIDFMRKYNTNGKVVVMNTVQAYLKSSRSNVEWHLQLAQKEKWTLGIKLVRGAYIAVERREAIHNTKAETDASYDGIVHDIMKRSWPGFDSQNFPPVRLFLAGHNQVSIRKAYAIAKDLAEQGHLPAPVEFGLLQGMADDIGCELLQKSDDEGTTTPCAKVFKCLSWGSITECLHYLVRRAIENQGAAAGLSSSHKQMVRELQRRLLPRWMLMKR